MIPRQSAAPGSVSWWLCGPAIAAAVFLGCAPFLLTPIPPLVDVPGHIAAFSVDLAPPGSPLHRYFEWDWDFSLNMGSELLMRAFALVMPPLAAGWAATVIATGSLVAGTLLLARTLNPRGAHGVPLALMFVFGLPWTWGFLNYLLAMGLALLAFVISERLAGRPRVRSVFLLVAQPAVLICHVIGGLVLPTLVAMASLGHLVDERRAGRDRPLHGSFRILLGQTWPLVATLVTVAVWKVTSPESPIPGLIWKWGEKLSFLAYALRDQHFMLDLFSAFGSYGVAILGLMLGARYSWRQGLPVAALWLTYLLLPNDINGSEFIDTRTLMTAMIATLALQDWSRVDRNLAKVVFAAGAILLAIRMTVLTLSFPQYENTYRAELTALEHIDRGSRVLVINEMCWQPKWRHDRISMLPTLVIPEREAWMNHRWTIPGVHMLHLKYDPAPGLIGIRSFTVRNPPCRIKREHLPQVLARAPIGKVDYLWLSNTGPLPAPDPRLEQIWHRADKSFLYRVAR